MPEIGRRLEADRPAAAMTQQADIDLEERVAAAVRREIAPVLDELRRFLDRRLAEVSCELNAAVQMVDFSEANLSTQIAGVQNQVARLIAAPSLEARNSGLELEAIVASTEAAANRIMGAAEAIGAWIAESAPGGATPPAVAEHLGAIFEACSFQDLTGQRIRRALTHLRNVEGELSALANGSAAAAPAAAAAPLPPDLPAMPSGPDLGQSEVDKLFG